MGSLPLHPALVHIPLGLAFVVPLLALGVLVLFRKDALPRKAWALVVGCQAVLVAGGFVAMRTGSGEEEKVERVVSEQAISRHEEAAEVFTWTAAAVLALSVVVLLVPARATRLGAVAAAVGMLAVAGLGVRVGHAGGQLVYQHNAGAAYGGGVASAGGSAEAGETQEAGRERER